MTELALVPMPQQEYAAWRPLEVERRLRWMYLPLLAHEPTARERAEAAVTELLTGGTTTDGPADQPPAVVWQVVDGAGVARGWVCLRSGTDLQVVDAEVDADPAALLRLLTEHAAGATHLLLERMVGVPTMDALAGAAAFVPTASNMALDLRSPGSPSAAPDDGPVRLVPMDAARFEEWVESAVAGYAREIEESTTLDHEASVRKAERDTAELLPEGHATADHWIFDVIQGEETVGMVWLSRRSPRALFVYDIEIAGHARGRGLGRAAMEAAARWARGRDGDVLALNVFGQNTVARRLYLGLGYRVVAEELKLALGPTRTARQ